MSTKEEAMFIQKSTIYDLTRIFEESKEEGKTYTLEEIKAIMNAYIKGAEQ